MAPHGPAGAGDLDALRAEVSAWLDDEPDQADRAELRRLLDELPGSAAELADRFAGPLAFGTAGLRGPLRAGPNGMNLQVVTRAAAGLVGWLAGSGTAGPIVIGYDARHGSREFAVRTAEVATGAGRDAYLLPRPLPTPVLAYAVRALDAAAGVMVTASHNPPQDNGYKVYLGAGPGGVTGAGAQIAPPADRQIEAAIRSVGRLADVPLGVPGRTLDDEVVAGYLRAAVAVVDPAAARKLTVAYTPLHGVGAAVLREAFTMAGFEAPITVAEQADPDPEFPTVAFPNPEEPGAMDRVVAVARAHDADLAIANDPDADRCAVAVQVRSGAGAGAGAGADWRMLRGDELGVLLADHLMRQGRHGRYATTIVSSSLLRALCAARGEPYAETLTGFKWIVRAGSDLTDAADVPLVFGYEEALGYCVAPDHVRDKDGITAALAVAELAAGLKAAGQDLSDRLDELAAEFGVYQTDQLAVRVDELSEIATAMAYLRGNLPAELLGEPVTSVEDLSPGADVVILRTGTARVVVRPSGTEPKLKAYLEVVRPVVDGDTAAARQDAGAALARLRTETAVALNIS
ncbi:phospho-sugar mutase [Micromonospora sp. NBC_01813]|uniref:phospho-sugar mutase n=1 Tax=Micromonospora sp. NBC_01813 TaxID=2975988 RepID=UPI002DD9FA20|nr:phospho-sugar mutase [Micromonospora sp. NBC_01813]WSA06161.1 phospho-sugar mutase [Micromonospora sp. NBC_01813]